MPDEQPTTPETKLRWYKPSPGRMLVVLLAVEGVLLLCGWWLPKDWAVLIAIAGVGLAIVFILFWFAIVLRFHWRSIIRYRWQSIFRRFHATPNRLLVVLLALEGILLLSEPWFPKGWAVLIAVASVGVVMMLLLLWFVLSLVFHWRFQFSIRWLMVMTIAVAIPSSWLAVEIGKSRRQREAVEALLKLGGDVHYDYEQDTTDEIIRGVIIGAVPPTPTWLRNVFGDDFFSNVTSVNRYPITDVNWEHLKELKELRELEFVGNQITDIGLEHLEGMKKLRYLELTATQITDVELKHLKGLEHLKGLRLEGTAITDIGLDHLEGMKQLQYLNLERTQVTDAGVEKLQKALPNVRIYH